MENFLNKICEILSIIQNENFERLDEKGEQLQQAYAQIDENKQWLSLMIAKESTDKDEKLEVFLLSYLLFCLREQKVEYLIEDILLAGNMPVLDQVNILRQLKYYLFFYPMITDEVRHYKIQNKIYVDQVEKIKQEIGKIHSYIPYELRSHKKILLMIEPLLGTAHAPTVKLLNLWRYFEKLGYEVYVYSSNYREIEYKRKMKWYKSAFCRVGLGKTGEFAVNYYGVEIKGYHIQYTDENYLEETRKALVDIAEYNPAFILTVGDANILADLCCQFTTVCAMACVNKPAHTVSNAIVRYFRCTQAEHQNYLACIRPEQKIFEMVHIDEIHRHSEVVYKKMDYGIAEEAFVILIAGNRLDTEVDTEVKKMLSDILQANDVIFAFIGDCPKLEMELKNAINAEHYVFLGTTSDFKEIMKIGNLFLNPPRQGGGTGAVYALQNEVPVLTLPECDAAQVGEDFICEKLEDMPGIVDRYIHDAGFMEQQKENCRKRVKEIYGVDSLENIKTFCEELTAYIKAQEAQRNFE